MILGKGRGQMRQGSYDSHAEKHYRGQTDRQTGMPKQNTHTNLN